MKVNNLNIKKHMIFQVLLFVVLVVVDQLTKALAVSSLKGNYGIALIKDAVEFQYVENSGAAFGILQNAMWLFYVITAIVFFVILILWLRVNSSLKKSSSPEAKYNIRTYKTMVVLGYLLSALAAGAVGNLIDRIINNYVVDFIYFKFINFPVFNFADICVTVSVVLICILFIFFYKEDPNFRLFRSKK